MGRTCPRILHRETPCSSGTSASHSRSHRLTRAQRRSLWSGGAIPSKRRFTDHPGRLGEARLPRHMESQSPVLRRRGSARGRAVRPLARGTRVLEHRRARGRRLADRHRPPAVAAVQPAALVAQPVEEHGILGARDVRRVLSAAVGVDPRERGVRRRGVALHGAPGVKLVTFFALALLVHGPLSPFLPTAFEATLLYYARLYPAWLLALVG